MFRVLSTICNPVSIGEVVALFLCYTHCFCYEHSIGIPNLLCPLHLTDIATTPPPLLISNAYGIREFLRDGPLRTIY
jgi:hypothetical protein